MMMKRLYLLLNLILLISISVTRVAAESVHVVQPGETLGSIAQQYGTTITALAQANNIVNPNLIYVGQSLSVSSGGGGTSAEPVSPAVPSRYVVQRGDTLASIAQRFGLTVSALQNANGIPNPNSIYVGQSLILSGEGGGTSAEPSQPTFPNRYVVQRGDTLASIALRFGLTVGALQNANAISNPNLIYVGQELAIPTGYINPTPPSASGKKQIVVDKSEQRAYVYQGDALIWTFIVSTGEPGKETWNGTWAIRTKLPNAYASLWDLQMPYWLGFYHTGYLENGFHALPIMPDGTILWDGYLGTPVSYGCVILSYTDAQTLYNWAEIGTEVIVRY